MAITVCPGAGDDGPDTDVVTVADAGFEPGFDE
jgi:hypothetical protein